MSWCCCIHLTHQCGLTDFKDASQGEIRVVSGVRCVCLVCVLPVCPCRGECGRGSVGEVLDVTIRLFLLLVRQLRTKNKLSESKCMFLKKQSDLQNIWTLAVNHTQISDQWLLWTSPNLHLVTFFLSELWSHALWKHSFTSHALMNVICTASKNGRASPAALRH